MLEITETTAKPHRCNCGARGDETPELDVAVIPKAVRHPAILGALESLKSGEALILKASHQPVPLLAQIDRKHPGVFTLEYLDEGPEVWRLQFTRV